MRFQKILTVMMALLFSAVFGSAISVFTGWDAMLTSGSLFILSAFANGPVGSLIASTGINWSGITLENGAVQDTNELIMLETLKAGNFATFHKLMTKVANGEKLDGIGAMGELGYKGGTTCAPTFNATQATTIEKTWAIAEWEVAEAICYKDVDATAGRMALKTGTDISDLTGTDIIDLVTPKYEEAMGRMFWRICWFGDTAADTIANGGKLKNGTEKKLFNIADGFFKRLLAIVASTPARKTVIQANNETGIKTATLSAAGSGYVAGEIVTVNGGTTGYLAKIKIITVSSGAVSTFAILDGGYGYSVANTIATTSTTGAGTGFVINITALIDTTYATQLNKFTNAREVLVEMTTRADIKLRGAADKLIMCTRSVADAYNMQLTQGTIYTEIQWKTIETGLILPDGNVQTMQYFEVNGCRVFPIDLWDEYIQTFEDNGTKWNNPHRAVMCRMENMMVGTPSDELIKYMNIWFSDDDQNVKLLARDRIGTLIFDDTQVQFAI